MFHWTTVSPGDGSKVTRGECDSSQEDKNEGPHSPAGSLLLRSAAKGISGEDCKLAERSVVDAEVGGPTSMSASKLC